MKAIIIAAVVIVAVAITITLKFRSATATPRVGMMVKLFLGYVPVLILAWSLTPDDLGFLQRTMLAEPRWFDLTACLFFYTTAFAGGLLQLYNLADRGLSLRVLAELHAGGGRAMTVDEIADRYSDGKGLAWMYDKRLEGLIQHRLVVVEGAEVRLTTRGWFWAERFAGMRRFLRMAPP